MERLITRDDGTKFVTRERLGSGLLAVVYAAQDEYGKRAAVKLPAPNLPLDQFKRFEEEYDLLVQLRQALPDPTVPMAWWGTDEENGRRVLLLEMAPDAKLSDYLSQLDPWPREELLLEAAEQYAVLLQKLHNAGYTCADRKMGDLRWNDQTGKLVVLDWNAVRSKQDSGVREDIHMFATLWYQLLTGRYVGSGLRLLDDAAWADGGVSIGTRLILLKAFSGQYANADELVRDVRDGLTASRQSGEWLAQQGREALKKATVPNDTAQAGLNALRQQSYMTDANIPELDLAAENEALRYLDTAVRKGYTDAEFDRQDALRLVQSQGDRLIASAALAFEITNYDLAEQSLAWANRTLYQAEQPTKLQLRVKRWQLLFHAGLVAIDETEISLRKFRNALAGAVRRLEAADKQIPQQIEEWQTAQSAMSNVIGDISTQYGSEPVTGLLNLFVVETECRQLYVQAEEKEASGAYRDAVGFLEDIKQKLAMETADGPPKAYIDALRNEDAFARLDDRIRQLRRKERTAVIAQKLIADTSAFGLNVPATYIMQRLEDGRYFFANDLDEWEKIEESNKLPALLLLAQLAHHQQTGQWDEAIADLEKLAPIVQTDEQVRQKIEPFISPIIERIKEMVESQEDDTAALNMINALQNIQPFGQPKIFVNRGF